jgi:S-adenosylmethionine synthetase
MGYLFTSESVSEGHPDKLSDQISDAILDEYLKQDPNSKVACETLVTTGRVIISGEIKSDAEGIDAEQVARQVIREVGYDNPEYKFDADSCEVQVYLEEQSGDIRQGVDKENEEEQGAGDQGMMFGYASNETDKYMPLSLELSHQLLYELAAIRKEGKHMKYLRPDSKAQVTIEYDDNHQPIRIDTIVISTQHDEFITEGDDADDKMQAQIKEDLLKHLIPRVKKQLPERIQKLFNDDIKYLVNPTGKFVIGGPHGDTGLTGRKIIVDTYGGRGAHGGGAFSGKDSSKVDRSAAYAARHIAKNMIAAGLADQVSVQVAYAIGVANPVGLNVNTFGTANVKDDDGNPLPDSKIAEKVKEIFDMRPAAIVNRLGLKNPIFRPTSTYGHMGRTPDKRSLEVNLNGNPEQSDFETFTWEKLDYVDKLQEAFKKERSQV